jgi:adenosylmethionine-8-amino-7-oxononanoate aminotransferase
VVLESHLPLDREVCSGVDSDNGSTAVEIALKMAVQWWFNRGERRSMILALQNSYHGDTFGAMAAGSRGLFSAPFDPMLFEVKHLSTEGSQADLDQLEELCRSKQAAAFIFEPLVQGAGGMRMYNPEVINQYARICRQHGVLCIADEVMTGFGRTGPLFASSTISTPADIVCLSKGLTNGSVPLALTACTDAVFQGFISADHSRTFFHGHTYTGNPIAAAIALASLELSLSDECAKARQRIHDAHTSCASTLRTLPGITSARVTGTILAFDVSATSSRGYLSSIRDITMKFFRKKGILLRPLGNVVYCMPPYCTTDAELRQIHTSIIEFASTIAG